jgi:hypothetical protein
MQNTLIPRTANAGVTPILSPFVKMAASKGPGGEAAGNISLHLATDGTLDGSWVVLGSNKTDADVNGDADAFDCTAAWVTGATPTAGIATVAHGTAATQKQGVQAGAVWFGAIAVKFTPSGGTGTCSAFLNQAIA